MASTEEVRGLGFRVQGLGFRVEGSGVVVSRSIPGGNLDFYMDYRACHPTC